MSNIKCNSPYDFLSKWIDITTILGIPEKNELRDREKEFLINTILYNSNGVEIHSKEMVDLICKTMKIKPDNVYNYRKILKNKEWLIQTPTQYKLLPALDFSKREIPNQLSIKFTLKIDE